MVSERKTKRELLEELEALRLRVSELEGEGAGKYQPGSVPHEVHQILESMFDRTHMIVVHLDSRCDFIRVSRAFAAIADRDPSYFTGKNFFEVYPSKENEDLFQRVLDSREVCFESTRGFKFNDNPSQEVQYYDWALMPIKGAEEEVTGLLLMLREVAQRQEREQEYKKLVDGMNETVFVIDFEGKFLEVNDRAIEVLGYSREELLCMGPEDIDSLLDSKQIAQLIKGVKEGERQVFETQHKTKDGRTIPVEVSSSPVTYDGEPAILSTTRDLTVRKKAEQELALIVYGIDQAQIGMLQVDDEGMIYYANQYACDSLGYSSDELLKMSIWEIDPNLDEEKWKVHRSTTRERGVSTIETVHRRKDGTEFPVEVTINFATLEDKSISISVSKDITDRKQAEQQREILLGQLQQQAQRLLDVMSTVPEGLLLLDTEHRVVLANPMGERLLEVLANVRMGEKLTHLGGRSLEELFASPIAQGLRHEIVVQGRIFEVIAQAMSDDQETGNWLLVVDDITLERQAQRQLQQQERLATVGQLAAGIAHDFNNILSIISLYSHHGLDDPNLPAKLHEYLGIISHQTDRARDLIQQILDFGRRAILECRPMDLRRFVKEQIQLLDRMLPETIRIGYFHGEDAYTVNADPTRMQQALLNLAFNARDAMPTGGRLDIKLARLRIDKPEQAKLPEMDLGDWVCLTVSDGGVGIPPDVLPHIFNPFFTTKEPGEGAGLGLAQVYGIVKQHDGHIQVTSEIGKGTTCDIYLPAIAEEPEEVYESDAQISFQGNGETILVVEDNEALLKALVEILEALNYRVLGVANGQEALDVMNRQAKEVKLVLSDLVMPEMGGKELLLALRQRGLTLPVVMMTGHPKDDELSDLQTQGLSGWLRKPPTIERLAKLVARVLKERSA